MTNAHDIPWKRISAEGIAIVVSILLAFGIQAWWENRNEVELEQRLLKALLVEFEKNSELLREETRQYERRYMEALRVLAYLREDAANRDQAELEELFPGLLTAGTIHLESGTHNGLLGSGDLSLIRDEELRIGLAAWPSYVREWSEEQDMVFEFVRNDLVPYLSDYVRLQDIGRGFAPFQDGESPPQVPAGIYDAASMVDVSTSIVFENLVYQRAQGLWFALRDAETLLAQTTAIADLTRENLEK